VDVRGIRAGHCSTDVHGVGHYHLHCSQVPWLTVDASAVDSNGREATFTSNLWIADVEGVSDAAEARPIDIYPDKHSYKPGDPRTSLSQTMLPGAQVW